MPKLSRTTTEHYQDIGIGEVREAVLDGYEISFLQLREAADMAAMLKGLPDDRCPCPHWGYVISGQMRFTFAGHTEVFDAGDAFYVAGGHTPAMEAGSEVLMFSPAEQIAEVNEVLQRNLAALQSA